VVTRMASKSGGVWPGDVLRRQVFSRREPETGLTVRDLEPVSFPTLIRARWRG